VSDDGNGRRPEGKQPRVVVVTGGTAGVGRATVRAFADGGDDVAILARGRDGLEAACREVEERGRRALAIRTDVPTASPEGSEPHDADTAGNDSPQRAAARSRWARLLARIYEVFPLTCPDCGGDMRILAFITAEEPTDAILSHLGLPTTAPPLSPARGPPQHDLAFDADPGFDLDQTPAYDLTEPERIPDFDFDQGAGA